MLFATSKQLAVPSCQVTFSCLAGELWALISPWKAPNFAKERCSRRAGQCEERCFAVGLPCSISTVQASCGLEFQRSSFHCCVLEVRVFYSRNKGSAKSAEARNLGREMGGSSTTFFVKQIVFLSVQCNMLRGLLLCHKKIAPMWVLPEVNVCLCTCGRDRPTCSGLFHNIHFCSTHLVPRTVDSIAQHYQITPGKQRFSFAPLFWSYLVQKDYLITPWQAGNALNPSGTASSIANFFYKSSNFQATVTAKNFGK